MDVYAKLFHIHICRLLDAMPLELLNQEKPFSTSFLQRVLTNRYKYGIIKALLGAAANRWLCRSVRRCQLPNAFVFVIVLYHIILDLSTKTYVDYLYNFRHVRIFSIYIRLLNFDGKKGHDILSNRDLFKIIFSPGVFNS
jgi:hypothetical protein